MSSLLILPETLKRLDKHPEKASTRDVIELLLTIRELKSHLYKKSPKDNPCYCFDGPRQTGHTMTCCRVQEYEI